VAKSERSLKVPTGAILSKYLRALALDVETCNEDGDPITKAQALAGLVWKHALGFTEEDVKTGEKTVNRPNWTAIDLLYSRIEGKIPVAVIEDQGKSLADKVSDLGKAKINALADAAAPKEDDEPGDS
jgi:hypothetical protein